MVSQYAKETMFSVYGSSIVGFFGGYHPSYNIPEIIQIDCTEADFFASQNSFDTYLYFNPYDKNKKVNIDLGKKNYHLYDLSTKQIVAKSASGTTEFKIPAQSSSVLVLVPGDKALTSKDGKLYAGDVVVDYWFGKKIHFGV